MTNAEYTRPPRSKLAAVLLALFLGNLGIHYFYLGHYPAGFLRLGITLVGLLLWPMLLAAAIIALIDAALIAAGEVKEKCQDGTTRDLI